MITLALDAGHGKDNAKPGTFDTGATSGKLTEADLTWQLIESGVFVAKSEYEGKIRIVLTRDSVNDSAPVAGRDDEAVHEGAQYLLSIHLNDANGTATGTETLYRDGADKMLAEAVQSAAVAAFGLRNRGVKNESESARGRLAIFGGDLATALCEVCFIDNLNDMETVFGAGSRSRRIDFWRGVFALVIDISAGVRVH